MKFTHCGIQSATRCVKYLLRIKEEEAVVVAVVVLVVVVVVVVGVVVVVVVVVVVDVVVVVLVVVVVVVAVVVVVVVRQFKPNDNHLPVYSDKGEDEDGSADGCLRQPGNDLTQVRVGVAQPDPTMLQDVHRVAKHTRDQVRQSQA
ncbi:hypothetical protein ElyMa_000474100 [Elysia marginata]|uniref:Uncharacterized protein n=1 Tax=Elysia marginata TaxID=1093978 RepID=A0AAV4FSD6_9GAST|nr:hypothetical protein ElyMa_000474100 [Elysia marginata]